MTCGLLFLICDAQVPCGTERTQRPPRCSKLCAIPPKCNHGSNCKVLTADYMAVLQFYGTVKKHMDAGADPITER